MHPDTPLDTAPRCAQRLVRHPHLPVPRGGRITMPFESRERAEKALRALDEDARRHAA